MISRRRFASMALASVAAPLVPVSAAASTASRTFRIIRDGSDIGRHALTASAAGGIFEIRIQIDIAVKVLGITAYRYSLENTERWKSGRLLSVASQTNEDGERHRLSIGGDGGSLKIDGTGYSGTAPADAVTTSYFARAMIDRRPWISSQDGSVLDIAATAQGGGTYRITGGVYTTLTYGPDGEWIGSSFDGRGERVHYEVIGGTGAIAALWASA